MKLSEKSRTKRPAIYPLLEGFDELPNSAHVDAKVVNALMGWSNSTTWRRVKAGQLAQPVRLGARTTRWRVGDLRNFLEEISADETAA